LELDSLAVGGTALAAVIINDISSSLMPAHKVDGSSPEHLHLPLALLSFAVPYDKLSNVLT